MDDGRPPVTLTHWSSILTLMISQMPLALSPTVRNKFFYKRQMSRFHFNLDYTTPSLFFLPPTIIIEETEQDCVTVGGEGGEGGGGVLRDDEDSRSHQVP